MHSIPISNGSLTIPVDAKLFFNRNLQCHGLLSEK